MLESRAERIALGAAPDVAAVDVGLNFMSPKTYHTAESSKKKNHQRFISVFAQVRF